jgi:DNA-directed RNA polymerase specialized sigma24 family protein
MPSEGSITQWLHRLQAGDPEGAQQLWDRYFHRLVGLARKKLNDLPRRAADEEDVALSAFHSFCRGAERGRFPQLSDRDNLWRLLFAITARKAFDLVRDEHRQKRGGGAVLGESALLRPGDTPEEQAGLEAILDREPTPAFAAQMAEEYEQLLDRLGDPELRAVAVWKMEGDTTEEIAVKLKRSPRSVERKLQLIRSLWEDEKG